MPKNKRGGKGHKKGGNRNSNSRNHVGVFDKDSGDFYARVTKGLGTNRLEVTLHDGRERMQVIIPGRMIKKVMMRENDYVCCSEGSEMIIDGKPRKTDGEVKWKVVDAHEEAQAKALFKEFEEGGVYGGNDVDPEFDFDTI